MNDEAAVADITVDREHGLTLVFVDGLECRFDLAELRVNCPCASCRTDRDRDELPWPKATSPTPLMIRDAELVGAWGLGITWNDGHSTGIYSWELLRRWCGTSEPTLGADSGLGPQDGYN